MTEAMEQAGFTGEQLEVLERLLEAQRTDSVALNDALSRVRTAMEALGRRLDSEVGGLKAEAAALTAALAELKQFQSSTLVSYWREEIRHQLSVRRPSFKGPRDPISFDMFCIDAVDPALLTRRDLYLDAETLDRHYADSFEKIGVVKTNSTWRFVNHGVVRMSRMLGRRFAGQLALPAELLTESLFYSIANEMPRLIPARHLARRLARLSNGEPVLIPLPSTNFTYICGHELEPFYLAAELQRRRVPVAFVLTDPMAIGRALSEGTVSLRFEPNSPIWTMPRLADVEVSSPPGGRPALAGAGIRGIRYILSQVKDPLKFHSPSPHMMDPAFGAPELTIVDPDHLPVAVGLPFDRVYAAGRTGALLRGSLPHGDLGTYLMHVMGGVVSHALIRTRDLVRRHRITEAHICEHPFFETAILAHAVREAGGKVILWPHGWGLSWWGLPRLPGTIDEVYSVDESGAIEWRKRLPDAKVRVVSDLYMPRYRNPRPAAPGEPLNVVVIGNSYANDRLPLINRGSLEKISRKLFRALAELPADIKWVYRPRGTDDLQWQWGLAGHPADFPYTQTPPVLIDLPNMIFLFPGLLSSALIEAIGRGIPSVIAREDDTIEDYIGSEHPPTVPTGDVEFIMAELRRCRDPAYRQQLLESQVAWCEETQLRWLEDEEQRAAK